MKQHLAIPVWKNYKNFRLTAERANPLRHRDDVVKYLMFD